MDTEIYKLSEALGKSLKGAGLVLATAESCTGGWISQAVTMVPGSSAWFDRGFVTYPNRSKIEVLGVRGSTLERDGAVSEMTVREMAEGTLSRSLADCTIAVSGVAGPDGGTADKPVGTVWLATADRVHGTVAKKLHLKGDRDAVRRQTVLAALRLLLELVARPRNA